MPTTEYVYRITEVVKVTDGDTYWLRVDVGFRQTLLINVRLYGYDCPEAHKGSEFEKAKAVEARQVALDFFAPPRNYWIHTYKDPDNFGRWLGDIWCQYNEGDVHLGDYLHDNELATVWPTRWRDEYDPLDATPVELQQYREELGADVGVTIHKSAETPEIREQDLEFKYFHIKTDPVHQGPRGVSITHVPTGIVSEAWNEKSQLENKARALAALKRAVAEETP